MSRNEKFSLLAIRLVLGLFYFYAGFSKLINPEWSSAGFLKGAKTFPELYAWFGSDGIVGIVDFMNEWGLTLLGISLILGLFVRLSASLGVLLMALYYLPGLDFPYVEYGFIIDDHIILISILIYLAIVRAGRIYGLDTWCSGLPICKKFPKLRNLLG